MRIISGKLKGRRLISSDDLSIRPTTDRIKELIFNVLQDYSKNRCVVDLFAGSGNLGIEAISRGAKQVHFVEKADSSLKILNQNLQNLKIPAYSYRIVQKDAIRFAQEMDQEFDLFLIDPPFIYPELQSLIDVLVKNPNFSGSSIIVLEHEVTNPIEIETDDYRVFKQKKKGRSLISFIERVIAHD
jgi:16S rRNA (guanine966-N2)-methyltransferase